MEWVFFTAGLLVPVVFVSGFCTGVLFNSKIRAVSTPLKPKGEEEDPKDRQLRKEMERAFQEMMSYDVATALKPKIDRG